MSREISHAHLRRRRTVQASRVRRERGIARRVRLRLLTLRAGRGPVGSTSLYRDELSSFSFVG